MYLLNITIIGMGLIGTSLGMALRSATEEAAMLGPTVITGYDRDARATTEARGRLAVDRQARSLEEALREVDVVIVAVPAMAVRELFAEIGPLLPHGAVVTDVASTKAQIIEWARELLPRTVSFVGGHPMAGKEQSGASAADPGLFKGAIYCLTPEPSTKPEAVQVVEALAQQVGAKPYYLDAVEHDGFVAGVSHLPFLLSTGLVAVTSASSSWRDMSTLAASGYRDISRLASGDTAMHRDICLTNSEAIIRWIDETAEWLDTLRTQLAEGDADGLQKLFEDARTTREAWLQTRPNLRPGEDDFSGMSVPMPERRGLFGRVGRKGGK